MRSLNILALSTFVIAKLLGLFGAAMCFVDPKIAAVCLTLAGASVLASIVASLYQMKRDRVEMEGEDASAMKLRELQVKKERIQWEIEALELERNKLMISRISI